MIKNAKRMKEREEVILSYHRLSSYRRFLIILFVAVIATALSIPQSGYAATNGRGFDARSFSGGMAVGVLGLIAAIGTGIYFIGKDNKALPSPTPSPDEDVSKPTLLKVTEPKMVDVSLLSSSRRSFLSPQIHYLEYKLKNMGGQTLDISEVNGFDDDGTITIDDPYSLPTSLMPNEECIIKLRVEISQVGKISKRINIGNGKDVYFSRSIEFSVVVDTDLKVIKSPKIQTMHVSEEQILDYSIKNMGSSDIDMFTIGGYSDPVERDDTIQNDCGSTLLAGETCNIRLSVKPNVSGIVSEKLTITYDFTNEELISLPIEIEVKTQPPLLDFTFSKISGDTNVTTTLIGTTNFKANKQVLEYEIENTGNQDIEVVGVDIGGVEINPLSYPIRIEDRVKNSCSEATKGSKTLNVGDSCTLKFIINPSRAIDISEDITVIAKDSANNEKRKKIGPINVKAIYKPLLIIKDTKDKNDMITIGEELGFTIVVIKNNKVMDGKKEIDKDFKFTTPIVIHEINEDINAKIIVTGMGKGPVGWHRMNKSNKLEWEVVLDEKPNDVYVKDNNVYVGGYKINVKRNWKRVWRTKKVLGAHDSGRAYGIREREGKIFVAGTRGFQYLELEDVDKSHRCYNFCGPYEISSEVKDTANKVHIENDNICVGTWSGMYISTDFGKTWNEYDVNTTGFAYSSGDKYNNDKDPSLNRSPVQAVHIDKSSFYAGTKLGLSVSEDGGNTWQTHLNKHEIFNIYAKDKKVWAVTKNKLFYSEDNGKNWKDYPLVFEDYSMIFFQVIEKNPISWKKEENARIEESKKPKRELIDIILEKQKKHEQYVNDLKARGVTYVKEYEDRKHHCEILGVHRHEQDCKVMQQAYRKRAQACHPDRNTNKTLADGAAKLVNEAYDFLKEDCLNF